MTTQHIIDLVHIHHPNLGVSLLVSLINASQRRFVKESYCLPVTQQLLIGAGNVILSGSTRLNLIELNNSDSSFTLEAYKDDTADTITIIPSTLVLFYTGFTQRAADGHIINVISVMINEDGTVYFYDQYGNGISEFPSDLAYLDVHYVAVPTTLTTTTLTTALDIDQDYREAIANEIIGNYYVGKQGMPALDQLTTAKHFKNLYLEQLNKARSYYRKSKSTISVTVPASEEFSS